MLELFLLLLPLLPRNFRLVDINLQGKTSPVNALQLRTELLQTDFFSEHQLHLLMEVLDALSDAKLRGIFLDQESIFDIYELLDFALELDLLLLELRQVGLLVFLCLVLSRLVAVWLSRIHHPCPLRCLELHLDLVVLQLKVDLYVTVAEISLESHLI